jgi:DNA-binding Lrp family transcriptional regulator
MATASLTSTLSRIKARLGLGKPRRPDQARNFSAAQQEAGAFDARDRGVQSVALDRIVGSVGRYQDFDSRFRPNPNLPPERLQKILKAMREGAALPPVKLYQIKDAYYVLDGNHRIAAAKLLGHDEILGRIVEFIPSQNTLEDMLYRERALFFDRTGLRADISLSEVGQYAHLLKQIDDHREFLRRQDPGVPFEQAARDWYKTIYRPLCTLIERSGLMDSLPGRTQADLYAYISTHQWQMDRKRIYGHAIDRYIPNNMEAFRTQMSDIQKCDYPEMQKTITAFVLASVQAKREYRIIEKLFEFDEVKEIHSVFGDVDLLIKIVLTRDLLTSDAEIVSHFVHEKIRQLNGVISTKTLIPGISKTK